MSLTPTSQPVMPRLKRDTLLSLLKKGNRIDGRAPEDYRPITIQLNPIPKAEGSALVKIGDTMVMTGIKTEIGEPFRDRPFEGVLQVHAEYVPLASPSFEPGPPDENAIEAARIIDRCLREPKAVKLDELVIIPGRKVWIVFNDIYLIDHDGNVVDAGALATMAALNMAKLPKIIGIEGDNVVIDRSVRETSLPLSLNVVTVTLAKIGDYIIVDPNLDEELIADARLTIGFDSLGRIVGMQKMGMSGFTRSELDYAIDLAFKKAKELHELLEKVLKNPETASKPIV